MTRRSSSLLTLALTALAEPALVACGTDDPGAGQPPADGGMGGEGGSPCVPTTCDAEGKDCGTISDDCGTDLDCGVCESGGCGAVTPNVCGDGTEEERLSSPPATARRARSAGIEGTVEAYSELFEIACQTADDCVEPCLDRGGQLPMCEASECSENADVGSDCLPPAVWTNLEGIRAASESLMDAVQLVVVDSEYRDVLLVDQFSLEIPDSAVVEGISVEIRGAGEFVADDSVRIVKGGTIGAAERASSELWNSSLTWVTYGGPDDLWGEEWTGADLLSEEFGLALSVLYTQTVGNTRAYVDLVRVTVHYAVPSP